jgi:hypothetical protein
MPTEDENPPLWDGFASHASEDKRDVVEPLVRELQSRGLRVWYDKDLIGPGQSLRQKIDEGLARSRVGIVVVSHNYFDKPWPRAELDAIFERHLRGEIVLIPIRHNMSHAELSNRSPLVGSVRSLSTEVGIPALADEIARTIRLAWLHLASVEVPMPPQTEGGHLIPGDRLTELRLAVIDELNELTAMYIVNYMEDPNFRPSGDFFQRLLMLTDRLRNLFSPAAFEAFKAVERMIGPNLGPVGQGAVHRFIEARNDALATLYRETGVIPPLI